MTTQTNSLFNAKMRTLGFIIATDPAVCLAEAEMKLQAYCRSKALRDDALLAEMHLRLRTLEDLMSVLGALILARAGPF